MTKEEYEEALIAPLTMKQAAETLKFLEGKFRWHGSSAQYDRTEQDREHHRGKALQYQRAIRLIEGITAI